MTEEIISNNIIEIETTREIKKINKKKKVLNHSEKNKNLFNKFEILKINEYDKLQKNNYSIPQLKELCRYYKIKISGNKDEIIKRLYDYLLKSFFISKIQKTFRKHLIVKYIKLHGPAFIKRHLCVNETDFLSMENLKDIPYNQFYSYKSNDNYIYGFDIISLYNLVTKPGVAQLNPYTRSEFPKNLISELHQLLKLSQVLKIHIDIKIQDNISLSIEKQIELKLTSLFQKIDELGNYTNIEWFNSLTSHKIVILIRELYDIWGYRAQLPYSIKREICQPNGDPFIGINMNTLNYCNFNTLKSICINIMEKFVYSGINRDSQFLGASFVLSALTLVSNNAAEAMPWLYQSVAHVNN